MKKLVILLLMSSTLFGQDSGIEETGKTTNKGILLSILLPGLGEQYFNEPKGALRGYIVEGAIWATYFGARWYADGVRDDYILHSTLNSGALPDREEKYYEAVEWYESIDVYNTAIREEAYARYEDPEDILQYINENIFPENARWVWSDTVKWEEYRKLRKSQRDILHKSSYCLGAAVLNRIISVLMVTYRIPKNYGIMVEPNGIRLSYSFE